MYNYNVNYSLCLSNNEHFRKSSSLSNLSKKNKKLFLFYFFKKIIYNSFILQYFFKNFYSLNKFNELFNYFFIFNCCFYNFYIDNVFLFFKLMDNNNYFYWFLIKFFKKQKKSFLDTSAPKKVSLNKSKKIRKYIKLFNFKKSPNNKNICFDLNTLFYFNYLVKNNNSKRIKSQKLFFFNLKNYFFESSVLKNKKKLSLHIKNNSNYYIFKDRKYLIDFFPKPKITIFPNGFILNFKKNLSFFKFYGFNFKLQEFYFKWNYFDIFINFFKLNKWSFYFSCIFKICIIFINIVNVGSLKKNFLISNNFYKLDFLQQDKLQIEKFKKEQEQHYSLIYDLKNYTLLKSGSFFKKIDTTLYNNLVNTNFYKIFFYKLIRTLKFNSQIYTFSNFNKYNLYLSLNNDLSEVISFFKQNIFVINNRSWLYNNYTPIYLLSKKISKKFQKKFKPYFNKKFNNYIYYYVIPFFENFLNKKIFIKNININVFNKNKYKKILFLKNMKEIFFKNKILIISKSVNFNLTELIEIVLYSFFRKDVILLMSWFIKNFKDIHFTQHKNFLIFFKIIVDDVFENYQDFFRLKGFYFILKGKIGITSNAKKKRVQFSLGSLSRSKKSQKVDFQQNVVKSLSGSIGVSMLLSY